MKKRIRKKTADSLSEEELFGPAPVTDESGGDLIADDGEDPFADPLGDSESFDFDNLESWFPLDPFSTSDPGVRVHPVERFRRAALAFAAQTSARDHDPEREEILRRIAAYWLRESRAIDAP